MTEVKPTPQTRAPSPSKKAAIGGLGAAALVALSLAVTALKPDEGKRNRVYADIAGIPTVCYGHTGRDVGTAARTDAQCEALLTSDARTTMTAVMACVPTIAERPQQLAAATRLAFNVGPTAYCRSGSAAAFRAGDLRKGCDLILPWDKARVAGKLVQVPGLTARRQRERAMCLVGVTA